MQNDVRPINAYIFADHLRDWQQDIENDYYIEPYKRDIISNTLQTAIEDLDDQSTIDAVSVVHGRWEDGAFENSKRCSVCKKYATKVRVASESIFDYTYCPHCGAKMDGGAEE